MHSTVHVVWIRLLLRSRTQRVYLAMICITLDCSALIQSLSNLIWPKLTTTRSGGLRLACQSLSRVKTIWPCRATVRLTVILLRTPILTLKPPTEPPRETLVLKLHLCVRLEQQRVRASLSACKTSLRREGFRDVEARSMRWGKGRYVYQSSLNTLRVGI